MSDDVLARENRERDATRKQRIASSPEKSIWVEASAGTGKTKVLSDRVLRLLLENVSPSKILCLTYTKAAAVEMSSRIAGRLSRWSILPIKDLEKELVSLLGDGYQKEENKGIIIARARRLFAVLLETPGGMKIQTIHAFCQEVLKRFPLEAQVSPYFEVMDERSTKEALVDIKNSMIGRVEKNPTSLEALAFGYLTANVSEYSFPKILENITENRSKISDLLKKYNLVKILEKVEEKIGVDSEKSEDDLILEYFSKVDSFWHEEIYSAWLQGTPNEVLKAKEFVELLKEENKIEIFEKYQSFFLTEKGKPRKVAGTKNALKFNDDLEVYFFGIQGEIFSLFQKIVKTRLYLSTRAILILAKTLIGEYGLYKKRSSKMDYEDLIVMTKNLLSNPKVSSWVLFKLDGGIDHILIDEAQDTSPHQWNIVRYLTGDFFSGNETSGLERTIFAVGDRKQSIYSFQGADPEEFEKSRGFYESQVPNFKTVRLDVSFRSTDAVLRLVNEVFSDVDANKGVVLEGEDAIHLPFRIGDSGRIELWALKEDEKQVENQSWELPKERISKESASVSLAKEIAQYIKNMVEKKIILKSKNRPVQFRDFLILVRRRNYFAKELLRECKNFGVDIAGMDRIVLLEQIAIQDLLAVVKFLLFSKDDLNLAVVLKSPIFELDDDDLFLLCYNRGNKSLWQRLCEEEKYQGTANKLKSLFSLVDYSRPFEIFSYILNQLEARKKFVERMGVEVLDGIDEFINLCLVFEREHIPSMQNFVAWMEEDDVVIKRENGQSEQDFVRIMTVHGAKGLQAPIVILPDTVSMVVMNKKAQMLWDEVFLYPLGSKDYDPTALEIKEKNDLLAMEEYRRLLYVAMTRAEDVLCICGYENKNKTKDESWYRLVEKNISKIASLDEKGAWVYETKQTFSDPSKKEEKIKKFQGFVADSSFLNKKLAAEKPLAKPYAPSVDDEEAVVYKSPIESEEGGSFRRGIIIHKLLQFLPDILEENRENIIDKFLERNADFFSSEQKDKIKSEVLDIFKDERFKSLFGKNSKAEVAIMGEVEGRIISAKLDRIVVEKDKVLIIDFKTNQNPPKTKEETPNIYIKQITAYKKLLEKIYPEKRVYAYILWVSKACVMAY